MAMSKDPLLKLNNGVEMPALGLGVFLSEPEKTEAAVTAAIAGGYRLIDTAAAYKNEEQVGAGLRASGIRREEVFVTTKLWMSDYGYEQTLRAFDVSLNKLGVDFLDLYMIHWPVPTDFGKTVESYKAMITILTDGRVRSIGVCNFSHQDLDTLIKETGHTPSVNQVELHPFFGQPELCKANDKHGVVTQAWSPIGGVQRYLTKDRDPKDLHDPLFHPTVVALGSKYGKTAAQVILRWHLESGRSPIPKSVHAARIAENFDLFDFSLAAEEVTAINGLNTNVRGGWDPAEVDAHTFS